MHSKFSTKHRNSHNDLTRDYNSAMMPGRTLSPKQQKNLHVMHIASGDLWAGAEVMFYTLARTLHKELDTKVTAIILNYGTLEQKLRDCGISVHVLDESELNSFQILIQINKIVSDVIPDLIHTHRIKENILGSVSAILHRIPSLRTVHGAPESRPPLHNLAKRSILFIDWLTGRYLQQTVVAVSPDLAKKLEHQFPKAKIKVIENGIDIDKTIHNSSSTNSGNKKVSSYRVGIAGRLTTVKRVDIFIDSALQLKQKYPDIKINFHIFGNGPLKNSLQGKINSQQANDFIHLEGHCENIAQILPGLDALLMTSDHEGLPMILLEAMCLQTPIIAHAVGGIPHLLDQGKCGVLVSEHTAHAFAEAIIKVIKQPRRNLTQPAFERVKQYYSAKHSANAYLEAYRSLID